MRVLVIDDHPVVVIALCAFLRSEGFRIVGHVTNAKAALKYIRDFDVDIVVMDTVIGREKGTRLISSVMRLRRIIAVAFSGYDSREHAVEFINAGGMGFVSKQRPVTELVAAIRMACSGRVFVSPPDLLACATPRSVSFIQDLSVREEEVASMIAEGMSSKHISSMLNISLNTVHTHRRRIFGKLGIHTIAELTKHVLEHGLASDAPTSRPRSSP